MYFDILDTVFDERTGVIKPFLTSSVIYDLDMILDIKKRSTR